jgi:hypothetical protein
MVEDVPMTKKCPLLVAAKMMSFFIMSPKSGDPLPGENLDDCMKEGCEWWEKCEGHCVIWALNANIWDISSTYNKKEEEDQNVLDSQNQ